jgi:hypothetical protein
MKKRTALAISILATTAAVLSTATSAMAATTVGNSCAANTTSMEVEANIVQVANDPSSPIPATIPTGGVITSWTINSQPELPAGVLSEKLRVFQPTAGHLTVVGESSLESIVGGLDTFKTRIPVQAGDLIGSAGVAHLGAKTEPVLLFCKEVAAGNKIGAILGDPAVGTTTTIDEEGGGLAQPITVQVEPDADGDGFGDETQDQCPTDASTQGPCPAPKVVPAPTPPAPITLSASAFAKKGLVQVSLTSTAQTTVTLGGSVRLGKGKSAALTGGSQIVAPGTLAKFTVVFPAKLKAKLRQLPPSQKVSLALTASAPGSTGTSLTVKVPGQKKATPRRHHRS